MKNVAAHLPIFVRTVYGTLVMLFLLTSISQKASSVLTSPRVLFGGWKPILPGHPFYFGPVGYKRSPLHPENEADGPRIVDPEYRIVDSSLSDHSKIITSSEVPDEHKEMKHENDIFAYYPPDPEPDPTTQLFQHKPLYVELPRKPLEVFEKPSTRAPGNLGYVQHSGLPADHPLLQEKIYIKITPLTDIGDHQSQKSNMGYGNFMSLSSRHPAFDSKLLQGPQIQHLQKNLRFQHQTIPPQGVVTLPSFDLPPQIRHKPLSRPRILPVLAKDITTQTLTEMSHNALLGSNFATVPAFDIQTRGLQGIPPGSLINHRLLSAAHRYLSPENLDVSHKGVISSEFGSTEAHRTIPPSARGQAHGGHVGNQFTAIPGAQFNPHSIRQLLPDLKVQPEFVLLPPRGRSPQHHERHNLFPQLHPKIPHGPVHSAPGSHDNQQPHPIPDGNYNSGPSPHRFFKPDMPHIRNAHGINPPVHNLPTKGSINDFRINPDIQPVHELHPYQERHRPVPDHPTVFIHPNGHRDSTSYGSETKVQSVSEEEEEEEDRVPHKSSHGELLVHTLKGPSFHEPYDSSTKDPRDQNSNFVLHQPANPYDYDITTETNYVRAEALNDDVELESGFKGSHTPSYLIQNSTFVITHEVDDSFKPDSTSHLKAQRDYIDIPISNDGGYISGSRLESAYNKGRGSSYPDGKKSAYNSGRESVYKDGREPTYNVDRESTYNGGRESTYSGGKESAYNGGREPTYNGGKESTYNGGREPTYNGGGESTYSGGKESAYNGGREPTSNDGRESAYNGAREPNYNGGRESTYNGGRQSTYNGGKESAYNDGMESTYNGGRESAYNDGTKFTYNDGRESAYNEGKESLIHVVNTPYSVTLPRNEKTPKNIVKHDNTRNFVFQNESSSRKNEKNSNSKITNDQKRYYNSRKNALIEESSNFQKKTMSKDDSKRSHRDEFKNDVRQQDSASQNKTINVTNVDVQNPQLFHAYYAPADHDPPEGYVRMSLDEFNKHFGNAEIRYLDNEQQASQKITTVAENKTTSS